MGKKKPFIDKKRSATFQLFARDSSATPTSADPANDRVFVRVDRNPYSVRGLEEDEDGELDGEFDPKSIFADAPEDTDDDEEWSVGRRAPESRGLLPDEVRKEIIELGLPDDGYNYLLHLREIRSAGGGSTFYQNSKAKLDQVPLDVKAYDASGVRINADISSGLNNDTSPFYVASKAVGVKVQRAIDTDVAKLLDDSDLSRFGSDVEDLDEDFVVKANLPDEEEAEVVEEKGLIGFRRSAVFKEEKKFADAYEDDELDFGEKPRVRRLLDEQFDLLTLREYDDEGDEEGARLAANISDVSMPYTMEELELDEKYRVPGDLVSGGQEPDTSDKELDLPSDVIQKCMEYAEKYCNESQDDKDILIVEESSDESEVWDCETIVSTYSNLDNHPGKIQAPGNPKKRVPKVLSGESVSKSNLIALRGKEKLPVEYLPHSHRRAVEKVKAAVSSATGGQTRRPHGEESREEKKERKAAVKEERREARRAKKELKELYRGEAQKAQRVAAIAGPSSIHLM